MNTSRLKTLNLSILMCFLIVWGRAFYWQTIKSAEYKEKVVSQNYKLVKNIPRRGNIFAKNDYPLTLTQVQYQLSFYKPNFKTDFNQIQNELSAINLDLIASNSATLSKFISNDQQKWITLPNLLNEETASKINIPGVSLDKIYNRYTEENLAKIITGFIGKNKLGTPIGYGGLEAYYNKSLQGKAAYSYVTKDATGQIVLSKKGWDNQAQNGYDLHTSINPSIQFLTEQILSDGISRFDADSGMISIIETKTGNIIALAATSSATPSATFKNPIIQDLFEPGSIFKPLVIAMALDSKAIDKDYLCTKCNQNRTIGEYTIGNWDNSLHPDSNLGDILKNSDNIALSHIITTLGQKKFLEYFHRLGLDQKTNVDLQGESRPLSKKYWPEIDLATASFGQGFAITQLNMLQAFNTIANNGQLVHPKIVNFMKNNNKIIRSRVSKPITVYSEDTAKTIKELLRYAVENGAVNQFRPKDLEVCGKSGTAQIAIKGGYTDSSSIASYIGFTPCDNPLFTMIVTINNPKTSPWGSSTAAPIWYDLAQKVINLL